MFRLAACLALGAVLTLVAGCGSDPAQRVSVDLTEWAVKPSVTGVNAGSVTFVAHNRSASMVHEVAVLKIEGANKKNLKEIEDVAPGQRKQTTVKLSPGEYELACVITPGESGSTVDHYQLGMVTSFSVR